LRVLLDPQQTLCWENHRGNRAAFCYGQGKFERRKKMAATVTGSKTCTQGLAPHLSATRLTSLLATPIENLTIAQFKDLRDALHRIAGGEENSNTIGALLK
jgi:hypothetical protein